VQHLAADCLVQVEGARSCVWHAAWAVDAADVEEATLAAHTAKAYTSRAARDVVEATIQMFGGVAITWEYLSHVRARRMLTDRRLLGDEGVHYAAIAATRIDAAKVA
jgi:alkylation response protein AidB-like acyl-CoA dehydrogenase